MCNLYSMTRNQDAIRRLFAIDKDSTGNLPSMPCLFPDYPAPIVRNVDGSEELMLARWGMAFSSLSSSREKQIGLIGALDVCHAHCRGLASSAFRNSDLQHDPYSWAALDASRLALCRDQICS